MKIFFPTKKTFKILENYKSLGFTYLIFNWKNKKSSRYANWWLNPWWIYLHWYIGKVGKRKYISNTKKNEEIFAGGSIAAANNISDFCKSVFLITTLGSTTKKNEEFIKSQFLQILNFAQPN